MPKLSLKNSSTNCNGLEMLLKVCIDDLDDLAPHKNKTCKRKQYSFYKQILNLCLCVKKSIKKKVT